jgi:hypothetical protein
MAVKSSSEKHNIIVLLVKYGIVFSSSEKKEVCAHGDQSPATFEQNIPNHFSYYKKISSVDFVWVVYLVMRIDVTICQVPTQKKLKDVNCEKLEEALAIYTATDRVINPFVTSGTYTSHLQRVFSSPLG